jgi:quinol monooxygenase YgiN
MHARSTTVRGRAETFDDALAHVRDEVRPAIEAMAGCRGMSLLVDRDTSSCIATSAWEDVDAMRASEPEVARLRDRTMAIFGSAPQVREWEIAVLHREHAAPDGACARVTWTRVPVARTDSLLYLFRAGTLAQIEALPGFCSASLLLDRASGESALAVVYENGDALAASRSQAAALRADSLEGMGAQLLDVAELTVAFAHLGVPETV